MTMIGPRKLVLIGIGAGNPEWVTLQAIAAIRDGGSSSSGTATSR